MQMFVCLVYGFETAGYLQYTVQYMACILISLTIDVCNLICLISATSNFLHGLLRVFISFLRLARPGKHCFLYGATKDLHQAVGASVIVDGTV